MCVSIVDKVSTSVFNSNGIAVQDSILYDHPALLHRTGSTMMDSSIFLLLQIISDIHEQFSPPWTLSSIMFTKCHVKLFQQIGSKIFSRFLAQIRDVYIIKAVNLIFFFKKPVLIYNKKNIVVNYHNVKLFLVTNS